MSESTTRQQDCPNIAVFTDLDGSLLDHDTYSFENARPALERIRDQGIPLVFASSKTRSEIEALQAAMGIREPFIVENGAAVFFPDGYRNWRIREGVHQPPYTVIRLGATYSEIRYCMQELQLVYNIQGFGDLGVKDIERLSGLSPAQAGLAKQREFTEPFLLDDDGSYFDLLAAAEASGFTITRGGRFYHLMGAGQDKGVAVRRSLSVIRRNIGQPLCTIGVGDSANDRALLLSVDIAILIPHPDGTHEDMELTGLRKARHPGSRGWNDMILEMLGSLSARAS
jgi:mannosyl-3-phosphoglycerate phosphatase